eukprot:1152519-Pyramimonas_sp.AAC.1
MLAGVGGAHMHQQDCGSQCPSPDVCTYRTTSRVGLATHKKQSTRPWLPRRLTFKCSVGA